MKRAAFVLSAIVSSSMLTVSVSSNEFDGYSISSFLEYRTKVCNASTGICNTTAPIQIKSRIYVLGNRVFDYTGKNSGLERKIGRRYDGATYKVSGNRLTLSIVQGKETYSVMTTKRGSRCGISSLVRSSRRELSFVTQYLRRECKLNKGNVHSE